MPGSFGSFDYDAHLDYQDWLNDVSKHGLVDEQEECVNLSVECESSDPLYNSHKYCTRPTCQCVCHV